MKNAFVSACFLIALASPTLAATDDEIKQALIGTWGESEGCKEGILVFNADGTFKSGVADDPDSGETGTYTLVGGKLNGKTDSHDMPEVTVAVEDGKIVFHGAEVDERQELFACPK